MYINTLIYQATRRSTRQHTSATSRSIRQHTSACVAYAYLNGQVTKNLTSYHARNAHHTIIISSRIHGPPRASSYERRSQCCIRQHVSAYVTHTSRIRRACSRACSYERRSQCCIRQHASAYVTHSSRIRRASSYERRSQCCIRQHTSAAAELSEANTRQHTSAYVTHAYLGAEGVRRRRLS